MHNLNPDVIIQDSYMVFCISKKKKSDYYILCRDTKRNYSKIIKATFGSTLLSYQLSILDKRFAFAFENVFASLPTQICTVST